MGNSVLQTASQQKVFCVLYSPFLKVAKEGGTVAGVVCKEIESHTGESIVTPESVKTLRELKEKLP